MKLSDRTPYEAQVRAIDARLKFAELRLTGFPVARVRDGTRLGSSSTATKVGAGSFVKVAQRLEAKMLPFYLVLVTVLFPPPAAGQTRSFTVESDVTVRADSFACKETSELDRLLQRNQSSGFTSGTQLYNYLKAHKCLGLTAGRARVYSIRGQYVCIYDPKDNKTSIYPCAWTRTEMLSK